MNMTAQAIVDMALANLQKNTRIIGKWKDINKNVLYGAIEFKIADKKINCQIEIKKEPRGNDIQQIIKQNQEREKFMVVAARLFPKLKEELRDNNIAYLEANGNIFLNDKETTIWIDTNKTIPQLKEVESRAFTKTGLKVVFSIPS